MAVDPLLSPWLIFIPSLIVGAFLGIVFERTRGTAARRAARFEADLVQARSELMRYRDQTKHHFGKSAELLGRMATEYREFLDHFVSGAEALCGPNMKEINASGLDRRMLGTGAPVASSLGMPSAAAPTPPPVAAAAPAVTPVSPGAEVRTVTTEAATDTARPYPAPAAPAAHANGGARPTMPPPSVHEALGTEPFAEAK